jgi:hypothetical protein
VYSSKPPSSKFEIKRGGVGNDRPTATMPREQLKATSERNDGQADMRKKVSKAWYLEFYEILAYHKNCIQ